MGFKPVKKSRIAYIRESRSSSVQGWNRHERKIKIKSFPHLYVETSQENDRLKVIKILDKNPLVPK